MRIHVSMILCKLRLPHPGIISNAAYPVHVLIESAGRIGICFASLRGRKDSKVISLACPFVIQAVSNILFRKGLAACTAHLFFIHRPFNEGHDVGVCVFHEPRLDKTLADIPS